MTVLTTVEQLKAAGEDAEWYPTTDAIIHRLLCSMPEYSSRRSQWGKEEVGIDEGGTMLEVVGRPQAYIEVGGIPVDEEEVPCIHKGN